ncbi:MAG: histidine phosphatase family protein [Janthinobacterium lividum]
MTHILLARHGETEWNAIGRVQGWADIPLSTLGQAQAQALAHRLRDTEINAVYSSDLSRALATATPVAEQHGLEVRQLPGLREKGYGDWEGLTGADLERDYAELWHRYHTLRDLEAVVPGGEAWPQVRERMAIVLRHILEEHPGADKTVLVVGHGGSSRALLLEALQAPLPTLLHLHLDNASLSRLDFRSLTDSRVSLLNDTSHLAGVTA